MRLQRMNHFSSMLELCRKKSLAKHFAAAAAALPATYDFCPKTYLLPEQLPDLKAELKSAPAAATKRKAWIVKPDSGCQGRGIALVQTAKHLTQVCMPLNSSQKQVVIMYLHMLDFGHAIHAY